MWAFPSHKAKFFLSVSIPVCKPFFFLWFFFFFVFVRVLLIKSSATGCFSLSNCGSFKVQFCKAEKKNFFFFLHVTMTSCGVEKCLFFLRSAAALYISFGGVFFFFSLSR